ncbi:hypothetical protein [Aeoliella sp.]|uniref:hypothetical protein n=1 Tax=Aeoliella sp. TaxID=2795800 RepID=UPI003CCBC0AD
MTTRFVLLRHEVPADYPRGDHWDLLLERGEMCWTWALDKLPGRLSSDAGPDEVDAVRLNDHRKHYLQYEGPVSENRGSVQRVLEGVCEWLEIADDRIEVRLVHSGNGCAVQLQHISDDHWILATQ